MIIGLVTVGLLCLLYEAVLVGVLALAQRREEDRREPERESGLGSHSVGAATVAALEASTVLDKASGAPQGGARGAGPLPGMRASDAERQAGADAVGAAMAEGRLDLDEGVDRLDKVFRARYVHELRELVADLPGLPSLPVTPLPAGAGGRRRTEPRPMFEGRGLVIAVVVTAFAVQVLTGVWVLWPVAIAALAPFALWRRPR